MRCARWVCHASCVACAAHYVNFVCIMRVFCSHRVVHVRECVVLRVFCELYGICACISNCTCVQLLFMLCSAALDDVCAQCVLLGFIMSCVNVL